MQEDFSLENIDQFEYSPDEVSSLRVSGNKKNRLEAKKELEHLVQADASNHVNVFKPTKVVKPAKLKKSQHVVDLTKQDRIKLRGLDKFERPLPRKSILQGFKFKKPVRAKEAKPKEDVGSLNIDSISKQLKYSSPKEDKQYQIPNHVFRGNSTVAFVLITLALILPVKTIWLAESAKETRDSVLEIGKEAFNYLKIGGEAVKDQDFKKAVLEFKRAESQFDLVKQSVDQYDQTFVSLIEQLPSIGAKVKVGNQVITIGQNLSQAAAILSSQYDDPGTITDTLSQLNERLTNTKVALQKIESDLDLLPNQLPEDLQGPLVSLSSDLPLLLKQLDELSIAVDLTNDLLGKESLSRTLIIFQNNRELRATGGFMGSYALADFQKGEITSFNLPGGGTYDVEAGLAETIAPPQALSLLADEWQLWDSNWWPDFPTSAEKIGWFYQQSTNQTVDHVIAINSDIMVDLLAEIGPIYLEEYDTVINHQNFYSIIQAEVEDNYDKEDNKPKQILQDAAPLIIERLVNYDDPLALANVLMRGLQSKDVQLYSFDEATQQKIVDLNWDGGIAQTDGDYLQVVSTNLGGGKSDAYISETINHRAEIAKDGTVTVTVKITKTNNAPKSDVYGYKNNVDYLRLYVPQGSTLITASGFDIPAASLFEDVSTYAVNDDYYNSVSGSFEIHERSQTRINNELGKTVFSNWMQVKPGDSKTVSFKYELPKKVELSSRSGSKFVNYWSSDFKEVDSYSLLVEKQAGKDNVTINSSVVLDPSYAVVWSQSANDVALSANDRLVSATTDLDKTFYYSFLMSSE